MPDIQRLVLEQLFCVVCPYVFYAHAGGDFPLLISATEPGIYTVLFQFLDPADGSSGMARARYIRGGT